MTQWFDTDHPVFPGHFPGDPLVPGVLILDRVIQAASAAGLRVSGIASAKFSAPLRPGQPFTVSLAPARQGLRFAVQSGGIELASGVIEGERTDGP